MVFFFVLLAIAFVIMGLSNICEYAELRNKYLSHISAIPRTVMAKMELKFKECPNRDVIFE